MKEKVLEINHLTVKFRMYDSGLQQKDLEVISDLNVQIHAGEIVAIAGSSGSGKSLLADAIMGILPSNAMVLGSMNFCGKELTADYQRKLRGHEMCLVPQSVSYLDPLMQVGKQARGKVTSAKEQREIFERYGLAPEVDKMYPFQLSGGMARRVLIASAVLGHPKLIIADEPTPGLSLDLAKQALADFRKLADEGCAIMLITHDIDLAFEVADKVAIFYAGTTLEIADAKEFQNGGKNVRHPYSKALCRALPQNEFEPIEGFQPYAGTIQKGCRFIERCSMRTKECCEDIPMQTVRNGEVKCIHAS